ALHYAYQPLHGDGEIIARVQSLTPTDGYTKAGVMIRETLAAGSKNTLMTLTSSHAAQLQWRSATNGQSFHTEGPNEFAPYFVRLRRQGDVITGYVADVAGAWQQVSSVALPMNQTAFIGLALTAHNNAQTATALFDNVSIINGGLPLELHINFQPAGAPVPEGYLADTGAVFSNRGNGFTYGWDVDNSAFARDRNSAASPDQRYDTLNHLKHADAPAPRTWEIELPNGAYSVHLVAGDPIIFDSTHVLTAEGNAILSGTVSSSQPFREATANVVVNDGRLTLAQGAGGVNTKVCYVDIVALTGNVTATLSAPAHQSTHYGVAAATVNLEASAATTNGGATITSVEFYDGFTFLGSDSNAPFTFAWNNASAGQHRVMVKAMDSTGAVGFSSFSDITVSADGAFGLLAEYWPNLTMDGTPLTRTDANIQFDWATGAPMTGIANDNFTVRWSGRVKPRFTGTYTFKTATDDGVRVWVNGQLVIDRWVNQGANPAYTGTIALSADTLYDLEVHYFENFGDASARVSWSSASQPEEVIPSTRLFEPVAGANHRPRQPVITLPAVDGELTDPGILIMQTAPFQDTDLGHAHATTDWEIWSTTGTIERVWSALNHSTALTQATLANGTFDVGFTQLANNTTYQLRVRHKDNSGDAKTEFSPQSLRTFTTTPPDAPRGVTAEYYQNTQRLSVTPHTTRTEQTVNYDYGNGEPVAGLGADNYSVRWRARVKPQFSEVYTFFTETDDGARLWVNGQLLVDKWLGQAATEHSGSIELLAGNFYDLEMQYYDGAFGASAKLRWSSPSQAKQIIPALRLYAIAAQANQRPLAPAVASPATENAVLDAAAAAFQSGAFEDQDATHTHLATDWEIWTTEATPTRIWAALNQTGTKRTSATLADGVFQGSHTGRTTLLGETFYSLRIRHRDSSGDGNSEWGAFAQRNFSTTAAPWQTWLQAEFTAPEQADPLTSGEEADPDHDGLKNKLEYAFRLKPKLADTAAVIPTQVTADAFYVTFPRNVDATDIQVTVEHTTTLQNPTWSSAGVTYEILGTTNGVQTVRARIPRSVGDTRYFARVVVTAL
ncbi:MAG: PA14 domain-containing protein, partial [Roseimicrobium sp.]